MRPPPRTSRLSILSLLLSLYPIVSMTILILGWMVYPGFFGPPPGHSSPLVGPSGGLWFLCVFGLFVIPPASLVVGIISLVRNHKRREELKGQVFTWAGIVISSLFILSSLILGFWA